MATHDIERTSLDAHVSLCAERYQSLSDRLESTDERLARLERLVSEIHQVLQAHQDGQNQKWSWLRDTVIIALVSIIGFLVSRLWI